MKFPEQFRQQKSGVYSTSPGDNFGAFVIPGRQANGRQLNCIAADGEETGWDHVSVTIDGSTKCPSWDEMCIVKSLFWEDVDCVVQFHPAASDHISIHPGCLHLWKAIGITFPMPPSICV